MGDPPKRWTTSASASAILPSGRGAESGSFAASRVYWPNLNPLQVSEDFRGWPIGATASQDPNELKRRSFVGWQIPGADFRGLTLTACLFNAADLRGADFRGCAFWECDFTGADLIGADLTGATFDRFTRWPAGFDAGAQGARLEE